MIATLIAFAIHAKASTREDPHYFGGPIQVRSVIVLPSDADSGTVDQDLALLSRHIRWTRDRYRELLHGHTFRISPNPLVLHLDITAAQLVNAREGGAPLIVNRCLKVDGLSRWNAPYVYVAIYEGTGDNPAGGGRPINGGHDKGGGIIILASGGLNHAPNFQSTLQHELGHSFGLPHVDVYGYDMLSNVSMMSYNPKHHTNGFTPSATPGIFIPEDLRGLAANQWAFKGLTFDPKRDAPSGYDMKPDVQLGPMDLDSQPSPCCIVK